MRIASQFTREVVLLQQIISLDSWRLLFLVVGRLKRTVDIAFIHFNQLLDLHLFETVEVFSGSILSPEGAMY